MGSIVSVECEDGPDTCWLPEPVAIEQQFTSKTNKLPWSIHIEYIYKINALT